MSPDRPIVKNTFIKAFSMYYEGLRNYTNDDRVIIRREFMTTNAMRMRVVLPLLMVIECINIIYYFATSSGSNFSPQILAGYAIIFTVCGMYTVILVRININNTNLIKLRLMFYSCIILLVLSVLLITWGEINTGKDILSTYLLMVALGVVPLLSLVEWFAFASSFFVASIIIIISLTHYGQLHELVLNMVFMMLVCFIFSMIQYTFSLSTISEYVLLNNKAQKLIEISERDPLTGVYNRRGFNNFIQKNSLINEQYAIFMIDIDDFKKYNDQYYHDSGDLCLQKIAAALARSVFRREDLVVRYGGEEFIVYLNGIEARDVVIVAERIQNEIALLKIDFGGKKYVTVSIGAAHYSGRGKKTVQEVILEADKELYNAKRNGKNCISYHSEIYRPNPLKINQSINKDVLKMIKNQDVRRGRKTILIVAGKPSVREELAALLSSDYSIITADNSLEALRVLISRFGSISAVLLDITMPDMEGMSLINRMRAYDELKNTPIIVLNGEDNIDNEKRALMFGAWDFVSRPYDASIIKFRLKNAIDRSQLPAFNQLKYLAEYDGLTGIYNKNRFFDATREMLGIGNSDNYVFISFDINRFQLINSFFGVEEGDRLLKYIANSLAAYGRYLIDYSYGRIEADNFAVCLPYDSEESVYEFVRYLREEIRKYQIKFDVFVIFGVYVITNRQMPPSLMLDRANLAARYVKEDFISGGVGFYTEELGHRLEFEQELTNEMNEALENGEFTFQILPIYRLKDRSPAGGEALARWNHPELGMIMPNTFIPVFERNGFIVKLDYYICEQVCAALSRWIAEGYDPLPISVNLSRVNLYNATLVDTLSDLTARYGVPNHLFNLEITENVYIKNPDVMQDMIQKLRARGFMVMMDDFGSGYSSLNMFKDIEIDILKVDVKFLSESENNDRGRSILESVINMAKKVNIATVVEGVERADQADFLASVGCDFVQGYYFSQPIDCDRFEREILAKRKVTTCAK